MEDISQKIVQEINCLEEFTKDLSLSPDSESRLNEIKKYIFSNEINMFKIDDHALILMSFLESTEKEINVERIYQSNARQPENKKNNVNLIIAFKHVIYEIFCTQKREYSDIRKQLNTADKIIIPSLVFWLDNKFKISTETSISLIIIYFSVIQKIGVKTICKALNM